MLYDLFNIKKNICGNILWVYIEFVYLFLMIYTGFFILEYCLIDK